MQQYNPVFGGSARRRKANAVDIQWGDNHVGIGGDAPIRVQSMTNTDTADAIGTAIQIKELAQAGSELVRITVNTPEAAAAVPAIRAQLDRMGISVPLIGDFHYKAICCCATIPSVLRRCPSTASTPVMSGMAPSATHSLRK